MSKVATLPTNVRNLINRPALIAYLQAMAPEAHAGVRKSNHSCPIAKLCNANHPGFDYHIYGDAIRIYDTAGDQFKYKTPKWAADFIKAIDESRHYSESATRIGSSAYVYATAAEALVCLGVTA